MTLMRNGFICLWKEVLGVGMHKIGKNLSLAVTGQAQLSLGLLLGDLAVSPSLFLVYR